MKKDALGRENPCPVCWRQDKNRPMCYRGEPWCSDDCRKVVQGEVAPNQKQLTLMPQWLLDRLGITSRFLESTKTALLDSVSSHISKRGKTYDPDDDEYYEE